jgi:hypothetical protein
LGGNLWKVYPFTKHIDYGILCKNKVDFVYIWSYITFLIFAIFVLENCLLLPTPWFFLWPLVWKMVKIRFQVLIYLSAWSHGISVVISNL